MPYFFGKASALRSRQAELLKEHESIEKEKTLLGDPLAEGAPRDKFEAYKDNVDGINTRMMDYQGKLENHENRVEAYNARFDE